MFSSLQCFISELNCSNTPAIISHLVTNQICPVFREKTVKLGARAFCKVFHSTEEYFMFLKATVNVKSL